MQLHGQTMPTEERHLLRDHVAKGKRYDVLPQHPKSAGKAAVDKPLDIIDIEAGLRPMRRIHIRVLILIVEEALLWLEVNNHDLVSVQVQLRLVLASILHALVQIEMVLDALDLLL